MKVLSKIIRKFGYKLTKLNKTDSFPDMEKEFLEIAKKCKPFTMTSMERLYSVYKSVEYALKNNIEGDYVECGVWKGGSSMMIALSLIKNDCTNRKIYLYDTYEGMTEPTENDFKYTNQSAEKKYIQNINPESGSDWCRSGIDEVKENLYSTGYPKENIIFVKGKVEDTIPGIIPEKIALLRLDTDWYESTLHEMQHLYPIISEKAVLIIDDYGYWLGCRKAIDEYFEENNIHILLNRIDLTGRIGIKF